MAECKLSKLDVEGSSPFARFDNTTATIRREVKKQGRLSITFLFGPVFPMDGDGQQAILYGMHCVSKHPDQPNSDDEGRQKCCGPPATNADGQSAIF